jgi:hypothetical protein
MATQGSSDEWLGFYIPRAIPQPELNALEPLTAAHGVSMLHNGNNDFIIAATDQRFVPIAPQFLK